MKFVGDDHYYQQMMSMITFWAKFVTKKQDTTENLNRYQLVLPRCQTE